MVKELTSKYYLRAADFDKNSNILPSAVLSIFQDIAGHHAENLGIGFFELLAKDCLWMIVRTKYIVEKVPEKYQTVTVKTWPIAPRGPILRRDYLMTDEKGEVLIRATSDWTVVNCKTRSLVNAKDIYPEGEFLSDFAIDAKLKKVKDLEGEGEISTVKPQFCDIDNNGHVNNTKYADYIINALKPEKAISEFQIDYQKEVLLGEEIALNTKHQENRTVIMGVDGEGEKKFAAEIIFV